MRAYKMYRVSIEYGRCFVDDVIVQARSKTEAARIAKAGMFGRKVLEVVEIKEPEAA